MFMYMLLADCIENAINYSVSLRCTYSKYTMSNSYGIIMANNHVKD